MTALATSRAAARPAPLNLFHRIATALAVRRQRHQLAELDDALLEDIGLTAEEARREARRPVWDVPHYWRR